MDGTVAQRIAVLSMALSAGLAAVKLTAGYLAGSTAVMADGAEAASDVLASGVVLFGLVMAARPPDDDHPYGHGRLETLSGFIVGWMLVAAGLSIAALSMRQIGLRHAAPAAFAIWPMIGSVALKIAMAGFKFRFAKRTRSEGLLADAWNDSIDILSGLVALGALGLTLSDPSRFLAADHIGGFVVGIIVIVLGLRVVRDTSLHLMDTMPPPALLAEIRRVALTVPGAQGVEKCFARKTGLRYHVDLHLEVDPDLTVRRSHEIATAVRSRLREELDWVADVLVHVEPHGGFD
jgi:cation diffusion facilitator family transporter